MQAMTASSDIRGYLTDMAQKHGALVFAQIVVAAANTTANAFVMIYLLRQGFDYTGCSVFLLVGFGVAALLASIGSNLVARDFVTSMIVGTLAMMTYYVSLMLLSGWALMLVPPIFLGIYIVMFWVPYNSLISEVTSKEKRGAGVGAYFLVFPAVSAVGPVAGGLIISLGSYEMLFAYGVGVLALNLAFLSWPRLTKGRRQSVIVPERLQTAALNHEGGSKRVFDLSRIERRLVRGLFAEGVQEGVLWIGLPVLSFEFAANETELGGYLSLFAFWGAIMTVVLGYLSDRIKDRVRILRVSAAFTVCGLVAAAFAYDAGAYIAGMSAANFSLAVVPAFLFTMLVDRSRGSPTRDMMAREFLLNSGRFVGMGLTLGLLVLDCDLSVSLLVAAGAVATIVAVR